MKIRRSSMRVLLAVAGCGLLVLVTSDRARSQGATDLASSNGDEGVTASPSASAASGDDSYYHPSRPSGARKSQPAASGTSRLWLAIPIAIGVLACGGTAWLVWRTKRSKPQARSGLAMQLVQTRLREPKSPGVSQQQSSTTRRAA